jgi:hypothetical protein
MSTYCIYVSDLILCYVKKAYNVNELVSKVFRMLKRRFRMLSILSGICDRYVTKRIRLHIMPSLNRSLVVISLMYLRFNVSIFWTSQSSASRD